MADQELTVLALTPVELTRLRKICVDSDYGDATRIFKRCLERGEGFVPKAATEPAKKAGGK